MRLSTLLDPLITVPENQDLEISGLALDSRHVKPGDLFFAYPGRSHDGREFIQAALANGAAAILAEPRFQGDFSAEKPVFFLKDLVKWVSEIAAKFYQYPTKHLKLFGVTGTNGKTSCSHYMASALEYFEEPCAVIGTVGMGFYDKVKYGSLTTPDPITLQASFHQFLSQGAKAISMEVSSHSVDQARVQAVPFEVGLFTNLTRDHLDYHGSMEVYGATKASWLASDVVKAIVINADDEYGRKILADLSPKKRSYAYSVEGKISNDPNFIYADRIQLALSGLSARIHTPWGEGELKTHLIGKFNLSNALGVITSLCVMGYPLDQVLEAASRFQAVIGRMETFGGKEKPLVVVDFAHTPDSLEKALEALREHCEGKLYCLFGCGGGRDKGKRPLMAAVAERLADQVMITDDNPREEASESIAADILSGFQDPKGIIVELDRSKAIKDIIQCANPGDCVLIAGRGGETHQQIGDRKIPFNDSEKVAEIMAERRQ